jgi:hypothetical protein
MINEPRLAMLVTVSDKMKKYSQRQVKQAELAREYQKKLGMWTYPAQGEVRTRDLHMKATVR